MSLLTISRQAARVVSANGSRSLSTAVSFKDFGNPLSVLQSGPASVGSVGAGNVEVKMVAAPINTDDLAAVSSGSKGGIASGKEKVRYVSLDTFKFSPTGGSAGVGGSSGVGVVTSVGSGVSDFAEGDMVVPVVNGLGTWTETLVAPAKSLAKVPADTVPEVAATLADKTTAYCLLNDFASLEEGDWIIQDGAETAVGTAVAQLAASMGVKTINVVSDCIYYADTAARIKGMGGDIVCLSSYLRTAAFDNLVADLPAPKLALSCAGGNTASKLARSLSSGTTMVVYGAKASEPIRVPSDVAEGVKVEGFWLSSKTAAERAEIAPKVLDVNVWVENFPFSDPSKALDAAVNANIHGRNRTVVFKM